MAVVAPLTPLRYAPAIAQLGDVIAPPYDVIDDAQREALCARSPYNVVRLILPQGEGDTRYPAAARDLERFRSEGALVRDETPAFYRYEQTFVPPGGGAPRKRRGFLGAVKVVPFAERVVLPHERTLSGPKEDRLKLFRATQTNLSPGFMLYADPARELDAAIDRAEALAEATGDDGVRHALGRVTDPEAVRAISRFLADRTLLIADGHHRYETAVRYAAERDEAARAAGRPAPEDAAHKYFMVFFANGDDPDLLVFPTHRHVHDVPGFDFDALLRGGEGLFDVSELRKGAPAETLLDAVRASGTKTPSLVAAARDGRAALFALRKDADLAAHPVLGPLTPELRRTDVALLHAGLIEPVVGVTKEAQAAKTNIWYPQDTAKALGELRGGKGDVLFVMNPTPVKDVRDVAEAGEVMPQKSTFFYPKVATGLCIHTLEEGRRMHLPG